MVVVHPFALEVATTLMRAFVSVIAEIMLLLLRTLLLLERLATMINKFTRERNVGEEKPFFIKFFFKYRRGFPQTASSVTGA